MVTFELLGGLASLCFLRLERLLASSMLNACRLGASFFAKLLVAFQRLYAVYYRKELFAEPHSNTTAQYFYNTRVILSNPT